jgi:MFS family permease
MLGITLGTYGLVMTLLQPFMGKLADVIDSKRLLVYGLIGYAVALLLFAFATNTNQLIVIRVLQGVTGAALAPTVLTIIVSLAPREKAGATMGIFATAVSAGLAVGPIVGGLMIQHISLTSPLYLCSSLSILSAILILITYKDKRLAVKPQLKKPGSC